MAKIVVTDSGFPMFGVKLSKYPEEEDPKSRREREQRVEEEFHGYSELALREYNRKHGTDLVLSKLLSYESHASFRGFMLDFERTHSLWHHINLVAEREHPDASDKPLILFAELYTTYYNQIKDTVPTRLVFLKPEDNLHGCGAYPCKIRIPFHQFRAGVIDDCPVEAAWNMSTVLTRSMKSAGVCKHNVDCYGKLTKRQKQENAAMAEFALKEYNQQHGTKLEFVRAWKCETFKSTGLVKDFREKETTWTHMNFVAKRPRRAELIEQGFDSYEEVILFAEMYLEDGYGYLLTTLSVLIPGTKRNALSFSAKLDVHTALQALYIQVSDVLIRNLGET
ncbi:microtubule-actin cross-linking factor 1 [Striga asiatica]|uniref:Microtubule-actin cross-linking factor 1 n=1 Tax=Striga asiatica TaxID=4170 RepID=A0A5A7P4M3_STRAF|nr:microtubule-actin cross-linking factor 1 [Striga asiatica]